VNVQQELLAERYSFSVFGDFFCFRRHEQKLSGVISAINFHGTSAANTSSFFFNSRAYFSSRPIA
jgi:hypothetical protein